MGKDVDARAMVRGYSDGDVDTNHMGNRTLESLAAERYSRRQTIFGSLQASAAAFLGTGLLAACDEDFFTSDKPQASAGADIETSAGRMVTLTGVVDAPRSATGAWRQTGGPSVALSGSGSSVSFLAPGVAAATPLTFVYDVTDADGNTDADETTVTINPATLDFEAVPKNRLDLVTVPAGYEVQVMTRIGDPIAAGVPEYQNNGTDSNFAQRIGDHGDALHYLGLSAAGTRDDNASTRGLMVQNHENLNVQYLHPNGPTLVNEQQPRDEALKEIEAHGVSVTEYRDTGDLSWTYIQDSAFNRRITPNTPMVLHGPVRGSAYVRTAYSTDGTQGRGTINNCANGATIWGTMLTCEENWAGYFRRDNSGAGTDNALRTERELTSLRRYGVNSTSGNYLWSTVQADETTIFRRWDARATAGSATEDFRNEPNQFGWVVELDPYDPGATPRKRTALGRMGHEGAWPGRFTAGQKVAIYMGDDSRREYMYKFVSDADWSAGDAQSADRLAVGDKYLDSGTLYVARFNADGTGTWLPLVFGQVPNRPAVGTTPEYAFADQADILINARLAGDALGATPMDRPEWTATNPANGEIYLTLTNNNASGRPLNDTNAANPRHYTDPKLRAGFTDQDPNAQYDQSYGNPNGHIIRLRENGDDNAATSFTWDIFLFGANAPMDPENIDLSQLTDENDFSSPDGLWFSRPQNPAGVGRPLLWIQTDDGAYTDITHNQMLAALPGQVGDGETMTITNTAQDGSTAQQTTIVGAPATPATVRRFLTGPIEAEITGVDTTPDGRTLFVGIQHPGEDGEPDAPTSHWPQSQAGTATGRPRSAIVAITKASGGIVGI